MGARLGGRLVKGAIAYARDYRPVERGHRISSTDILAQAGYRYAWDANRRMPGVDPAAALWSALLFATDWPDWATELARRHPGVWSELVVPLLAREVAAGRHDDPSTYGRFLSTVSHLDEEVRATLSAPLFRAITDLRVIDGPDMDRIVRILRADPDIEASLPAFAARHAREAWHEGSARRALDWLAVWAETDPAALRTLLAWMDADADVVARGLRVYAGLFGERSTRPPEPLDVRARFAEFAYSHIRPVDDAPVREGPHSVTSRDNLQHLRGSVGELLEADFDAAERDVLERLLASHVVPVSPGWADRWRNRYAQRSVRPRPWSHETVLAFGEELGAAPATGGELHVRVGRMIADLQRELATAEFDRRGLFPTTILESDFRAWLGHALDGRRRPWFSIVQEAETAAAARTDLRIELRGAGAAVVVVEIKLIHRWEYGELLESFRSQLVDRYLLSDRVSHGIYLLVDLGRRPKGTMPDGSTPDGGTVVNLINAAATGMAAAGGPVATAQFFKVEPTRRNRRRDEAARAADAGLAAGPRAGPRRINARKSSASGS